MDLILIYNAGAGGGIHSPDALVTGLEAAGHRVRARDKHAKNYAEVFAQPADAVVVAGGDGMVAEVIRNMPDRRVPIAILPLGTANNIARSFGICGDVPALARSWPEARRVKLDLFEAYGPWGSRLMTESLGLGCLAQAQDRARRGKDPAFRTVSGGREKLAEYIADAQPARFDIRTRDEDLSGEYLGVEILNIGRIGASLPMHPQAEPGDGCLDVALIPKDGREALAAWLRAPEALACPVRMHKAGEVRLEWEHATLRLDDSFPARPGTSAHVGIRPSGTHALLLV
jgi:diacylglycerol kinase (ATP)